MKSDASLILQNDTVDFIVCYVWLIHVVPQLLQRFSTNVDALIEDGQQQNIHIQYAMQRFNVSGCSGYKWKEKAIYEVVI